MRGLRATGFESEFDSPRASESGISEPPDPCLAIQPDDSRRKTLDSTQLTSLDAIPSYREFLPRNLELATDAKI